MTLPQNVKDAVERGDRFFSPDESAAMSNGDWLTIRAELHRLSDELADYKNASLHSADDLVAKDAEIVRLTRGNIRYAQNNANLLGREHVALKRAELAESRLAAANALLREAIGWNWLDDGPRPDVMDVIDQEIQAHLQGDGDEA